MSLAADATKNPTPAMAAALERIQLFLDRGAPYAYEYIAFADDSKLEVRKEGDLVTYTETDNAGRPIGDPKPDGDFTPYLYVGKTGGVSQPPPIRPHAPVVESRDEPTRWQRFKRWVTS